MTPLCSDGASDTTERPAGARLLKWGFWSGEILLVGTYLLGHTAAYVPPDTLWALQLVALGVPYLGLALVAVAAGAALARRWMVSAFLLMLWSLPILLPALMREGAVRSVSSLDSPSLMVVSFNANPTHVRVQGEQLAGLLARERPHLFALQEMPVGRDAATGRSLGGRFLGPLLRDSEYVPSWPVGEANVLLTLPVFSRIGLAGPAERLFGHPPEGLWESGGVDRVLVHWQGQRVAVYNVHLRSFSGERPWEVRDGERRLFSPSAWYDAIRSYRADFRARAEQARRLRAVLRAEPHPFIVCGDLNSTSNNWVYAHLAAGLQDAFGRRGRGWGGPTTRVCPCFASISSSSVRNGRCARRAWSRGWPPTTDRSLRSSRCGREGERGEVLGVAVVSPGTAEGYPLGS